MRRRGLGVAITLVLVAGVIIALTGRETHRSLAAVCGTHADLVVVSGYKKSSADDGLYLTNEDGTSVIRLTKPGILASYPVFTSDRQTIVFNRRTAVAEHSGSTTWAIGVDGSNLRQVSPARSPNVLDPANPSIGGLYQRRSPDGSQFAYMAAKNENYGQVWVVDADGHNAHPIAKPGGAPIDWLTWSSDGTHVLYTTPAGTAHDLFAVDLSNGQVSVVGHNVHEPVFTTDGRMFAFTSAQPGGALHLTTVTVTRNALSSVRYATSHAFDDFSLTGLDATTCALRPPGVPTTKA